MKMKEGSTKKVIFLNPKSIAMLTRGGGQTILRTSYAPARQGQGFVGAAADGLTDGWMGSKEGTGNNLYDRSAVCEKAINGQLTTNCKKEEGDAAIAERGEGRNEG